MSERISIGERYAVATRTSNLRMRDGRCDADLILAAGYATANSPRKSLGLKVYRLQVTGNLADVAIIEAEMNGWLTGRLSRSGNRPMPAMQRHELVRQVLRWWVGQRCNYCGGLGFELVEGAPALSATECASCHGRGRTALNRAVPPKLAGHAAFLAHELDSLCLTVIGDLADVLGRGIDL